MSLSALDRQEIANGQAVINRRRGEFAYMANGSRKQPHKPQPPQIEQQSPEPEIIQATESQYPETVTFYTVIGLHAARVKPKIGGAWRLYVLAKALDTKGIGRIPLNDLRDYALHLGASPRKWQLWIKRALKRGIFYEFTRDGKKWIDLPSPAKTALAMGAYDIGKKAEVKASLLVKSGWKNIIQAAYVATFNGAQISREKMQKTSNVPTSTQRYRENKAGVKRQAHYAQSNLKADSLPMLQDFSDHKGVFLASNKRIYWRLPDSRTTDQALYVGRGRMRKAIGELRELQRQNGLLIMQRAFSDDLADSEYIRLFNLTDKQRKASERKVGRQDNTSVFEVYLKAYENKQSGAGIWDVYEQI